jgi:hypothetical protein
MKLFIKLRTGAKAAPVLIVFLYNLFFILDLFTTYLASPDMRYEGNWIVRHFNLNWSQFIFFYSFTVLIITSGIFFAFYFLHKYYQENIRCRGSLFSEMVHNKKLLLSLIILGCFYSHVINLALIIINNIMCYIYLFQAETILSRFAISYVSSQKLYLLYIQTVPILLGYCIAINKVRKIRNKYRIYQ